MKALLPLTLATLLPLSLAACGDTPEARFERAQQEFAGHDYRSAQVDLAAALQAEPDNPAALELAVRNHLAQGDGVAAQTALDRLERLDRAPADVALLAGEAALLRGQAKRALAAVDGLTSAEASRLRALAQLMLDRPDAAAKSFAAGVSAPGDKVRLLADYARFKLRRGDLKGARALAAQALAADPGQLDALLASAQVATVGGDLARALALYDKAARTHPNNLAALTGQAGVLGDLGRDAELAALTSQIAKVAPGDPGLAWLEARAAAKRKDWAKVRDILQPHEAGLVSRDEAMLLYAQAQLGLGQAEQARVRLEPLVRRAPGNALAVLLLAQAKLDGGDAPGASEALRPLAARPEAGREVLALMARASRAAEHPEAEAYAARAGAPTPQALASELAKGDTALKAGDWRAAATAYERILAVTDGTNALVLNNLAFAQSKLGNKAEALALALRALKHAPNDASVMDTAGWLMVETGGDRNRALDLLRAAAKKAPANPTIRDHLAQAEARG